MQEVCWGFQLLRRAFGSSVTVGRSAAAGFKPEVWQREGLEGWGQRLPEHSFAELLGIRRWVSLLGGRDAEHVGGREA